MILKKEIEAILLSSGAIKCRIIPAGRPDAMTASHLIDWLDKGFNAGMDYMERNQDIRFNPALLLDGTNSIITLAFNYTPAELRAPELPQIASFAYGFDYHNVIREALQRPVTELKNAFGGDYRICIDSAPVLERYWAEKSGLGYRCDNGLVTVGDYGTRVFLAEILTTLPADTLADREAPEEKPRISYGRKIGETHDRELIAGGCTHCEACQRACPTKALQKDGTVDARRCLSYLTIEQKGEWDAAGTEAMNTAWGRHTLFGCDLCQMVCPLNDHAPATAMEGLQPIPGILTLTAGDILEMAPEDFSRIFKGSALKRAKLEGLRRNALNITPGISPERDLQDEPVRTQADG